MFLYLADEIKRIYLLRLIVQHLYAHNYWIHCPNEHSIVIPDDEGNVLKEEKINLLKNDEFVRLINSIVIGSGKREDDEDIDHMSNYC